MIIALKAKALRNCCPLKTIGFPDIKPCSLPNAIKLPENVKVPINTLIHTIKNLLSGEVRNVEDATNADAPPPNPLKIATICGISVIWIRVANNAPILPPMINPIAINSKSSFPEENSVAAIATNIPIAAIKFPLRAVFG